MDAIGLNGNDLDVVLMQMVNLMRDGQPVRMSKRTGNAITLTDLLEEVPIDSARFLFNMHDAGSGIDFDLDQPSRPTTTTPCTMSSTHTPVSAPSSRRWRARAWPLPVPSRWMPPC